MKKNRFSFHNVSTKLKLYRIIYKNTLLVERSKENRNKLSFEKAAEKLLQRIKKADKPEKHEIASSWKEVERILQQEKKRVLSRHIYYYVASVAAFLALVCSTYIFYFPRLNESEISADLLNDTIPAVQNEILLIAQNEKIELQDEAFLHYTKDGTLNINKKDSLQNNSDPLKKKNNTQEKEEKRLNHIIVPEGRRANIIFADGTRMYINAGTRVIYPAVFEKDKREIVVEGEVFLEVSKDTNRPFIVKTNGFDVKVLGTIFNVCAYKGEPSASVVLVEGSVEVKPEKSEKVKLTPNQLIDIREYTTEVKNVDVLGYICWKDNMMLLTQRKVGEVLDRLARYYNCPLRYDSAIYDIPISGKLDLKDDIKDVIDIICLSLSLKSKINDNNEIYITP